MVPVNISSSSLVPPSGSAAAPSASLSLSSSSQPASLPISGAGTVLKGPLIPPAPTSLSFQLPLPISSNAESSGLSILQRTEAPTQLEVRVTDLVAQQIKTPVLGCTYQTSVELMEEGINKWTDFIYGKVTLATINKAFIACCSIEGFSDEELSFLYIYSYSGRRLLPAIALSGLPAFIAASQAKINPSTNVADAFLLVLTSDGMCTVWNGNHSRKERKISDRWNEKSPYFFPLFFFFCSVI